MATDSFKVKKSLNLEPIAGASPSAEGDVVYDDTANAIKYNNGSSRTVVNTDEAQTLTNKTLASPTITGTTTTPLTASRAVATGASSELVASATTATELGYVAGVTSAVQTQLNAKAPSASPTFSGTITTPLTASRAVVTGASSELAAATTTATEIGYVNGVTSAIQTQLDAKIPKTLTTTTGDMIYASSANTPARLAIGSSGQVLKTVGGVPTWSTFSGGINYLSSNPDAESDTTGWSTYADAAATSPVDGTGGSPTTTWTRTTSSPLRGSGSFLLTKDAANRQGEGVGFAFTIDAADKYSVLQCSFDYQVASGTYADDDLTVWVYDVTNATLIQPAPYKIKNTSISQKMAVEFQATSSTSYRLIVHVTSTSASAYTVKFDNWNLGPQAKLYGSPVTDWISWTPTGSWSTNTTYTGFKRRVGDTEFYRVKVATSGAPTSASLTITLPVTIDTAKLQSTLGTANALGFGNALDAGTNNYPLGVWYSSTTAVAVNVANASGTYVAGANVTQAVPFTFGASDEVNVEFSVPVVGYSSSVVMSSDAATNVVAAKLTGGTTSISTAKEVVGFTTAANDTNGATTTGASAKFTAPVPGYYRFSAAVQFNSAVIGAGGVQVLYLFKGGVETMILQRSQLSSVTTQVFLAGSGEIYLLAGEYIDIRCYNNTTTSLDGNNYFTVSRISGPAQIAASETVAAVYQISASTGNSSVADNATEIIDFDTKVLDTHGAVTTGASWKFTAPISGLYAISANLSWANTTNLANGILAVYKNAAQYSWLQQNLQLGLSGNVSIRLLAGEYVDIRAFQDDSASAARSLETTASRHTVSITRVGNY